MALSSEPAYLSCQLPQLYAREDPAELGVPSKWSKSPTERRNTPMFVSSLLSALFGGKRGHTVRNFSCKQTEKFRQQSCRNFYQWFRKNNGNILHIP